MQCSGSVAPFQIVSMSRIHVQALQSILNSWSSLNNKSGLENPLTWKITNDYKWFQSNYSKEVYETYGA
jgi:hypothetical protein